MHYGKEDQEYYKAGGTTAMPVPASPSTTGHVVYVSTATPSNTNNAVYSATPRRPRPVSQWSDHICDWPSNLYPSAYCACCVCWGMWINAQMAHKVGLMNFWTVVYITCTYWFVSFILQCVYPSTGVMGWMMLIFSLIFSIILRLRIYSRDNINTPGGVFSEFCMGFWCCPCSIAQMARHLYGYNKVLDGDGDPERPDNYAQQV